MKRAILLIALLAAGCKHTPEPPQIREVLVPTPVRCIDPATIPPEPSTVGERFNGDAKHDLKILAPNAQALRQWGQKLRTLLEACMIEGSAAGEPGLDEAGPETGDADAAETKAD